MFMFLTGLLVGLSMAFSTILGGMFLFWFLTGTRVKEDEQPCL